MDRAGEFSCDLIAQSQKHIRFLHDLHQLGVTLQEPSLKSLQRYTELWLPMVAKEVKSMVPPPDVAWLWHCHRLAPGHYERYVLSRFGKLVEAVPPFEFQVANNDEGENEMRAISKWTELYVDEPFFLDSCHATDMIKTEKASSGRLGKLDKFDLIASTQRQAGFLWQVSGISYQDESFLKQAVCKYYQFLKLPTSTTPLIPTFQIDLMWHTHILFSIEKYNADCVKIRFHKLDHDDSLSDRTPGGVLDVAYKETERKWKAVYNEDYAVIGGMYQGEPPSEYFHANWKKVEAAPKSDDHELNWSLASNSVPKVWPSLDTRSTLDGKPLFIKSQENDPWARSQTISSYIYGSGPRGDGFYHFCTKGAYMILLRRLRKKEQCAHLRYSMYAGPQALCCFGRMTTRQVEEKNKLKEKWRQIKRIRAHVERKLASRGPAIGDFKYFQLVHEIVDNISCEAPAEPCSQPLPQSRSDSKRSLLTGTLSTPVPRSVLASGAAKHHTSTLSAAQAQSSSCSIILAGE